jgi:hypothetical protein
VWAAQAEHRAGAYGITETKGGDGSSRDSRTAACRDAFGRDGTYAGEPGDSHPQMQTGQPGRARHANKLANPKSVRESTTRNGPYGPPRRPNNDRFMLVLSAPRQAFDGATNSPCDAAASRMRGSNVTTVAASASIAVARGERVERPEGNRERQHQPFGTTVKRRRQLGMERGGVQFRGSR